MAYGYSPEAPTARRYPTHTTATAAEASTLVTKLWPAILALAAVGGSLALTCVAPFAAFAVATAGTLRLRSALGTMAVIWLANQAVGFGALGYPWTLNTVLWGLAMVQRRCWRRWRPRWCSSSFTLIARMAPAAARLRGRLRRV